MLSFPHPSVSVTFLSPSCSKFTSSLSLPSNRITDKRPLGTFCSHSFFCCPFFPSSFFSHIPSLYLCLLSTFAIFTFISLPPPSLLFPLLSSSHPSSLIPPPPLSPSPQ